MKKSRQLKNKIISILPFISFKNPIIELEDYFIVSELALDKVQIVNDELKNSLKQYANNQNEFLKTTYKTKKNDFPEPLKACKLINLLVSISPNNSLTSLL